MPGDGLAAVDVLLALEALRRHLKGPREKQHDGEAEHQEYHEYLQHPVRRAKGLDREFRDLRNQPADHRVGDTHADDVAALEFFKKGHQFVPSGAACSDGLLT